MKILKAADLFCGAGGSSTGLRRVADALGVGLDLTALNHWDAAIETHAANHPEARHICEPIDKVVPRDDGKATAHASIEAKERA